MKAICILIFSALMVSIAEAKTIAMVLEAKGPSFVFTNGQGPKQLAFGDKIQDLNEVMVEDNSTLSLADYEGHQFHLSGGTHIKFFNNVLELKNGNLWVQSKNKTQPFVVQTVNSLAKYNQGEFIISFNNYVDKSQVLVLDGLVTYSNALDANINVEVKPGEFSIVEPKYENGLPRASVKVGLNSYQTLRKEFDGIKNIEKNDFTALFGGEPTKTKAIAHTKTTTTAKTTSNRSIASVSETAAPTTNAVKKGTVTIIKTVATKRMPASVTNEGAYAYYKNAKEKEKLSMTPSKTKKSAPVAVFGYINKEPEKTVKAAPAAKKIESEAARLPASVGGSNLAKDLDAAFEKSLLQKSQTDTKNPTEVNNLIDELKSYKAQYKKDY